MPLRRSLAFLVAAILAAPFARAADAVPDDGAASAATTAAPQAADAAKDAAPPLLKATLHSHSAAGKQPTTCAIVDDGRTLLVTNRGDNTVSVFATGDMTVTKTIGEVGYSAWGVIPRSGDQILVANWAGSSVALIDRSSGKRLWEVPVGMKPSYLALSPDGNRVYSAGNFSDDVTIGDVNAKKTLKTLPVGRRPMGVALSKDAATLWVAACDSKRISAVDLAAGAITATIDAPLAGTTNLQLTPDGTKLLAAGQDGALLVIDVATSEVKSVRVGVDTSSVAVTPGGRVALVADYTNATVSMVDLHEMKVYDRVAVGEGTLHVETDGKRFYTCNDKAGSVSAFVLEPLVPATAAGL